MYVGIGILKGIKREEPKVNKQSQKEKKEPFRAANVAF